MRKKRIPILTALALGFMAICVIVIGFWDIFPGARSQTLARQEQVFAEELSAAIEEQRQAAAKLTRSASFEQRFRKLSDRARKKGTVPVIVRVRAAFRPEGQIINAAERLAQRNVIGEAQDRLLAQLRYVPSSLKKYKYVPYIAASVDAAGLEQLQSSSEALDISGDTPMRLATAESLPLVGAPNAWAGGFTGAGKTIAVLDSGVDKGHPSLSGKVVSEACFSTNDAATGYSSLCPGGVVESTDVDSGVHCTVLDGLGGCSHGTHIAGVAAGRSGVAIDANIISIQVMSFVNNFDECRGQASCIRARPSDVINALGHVYELRATHDIAAVNVSLAIDGYTSHCDAVSAEAEAMKGAIDLLRSVNIATVVASGNEFFTDALSFPACISSAISVGATGDGSASDTPVDTVAQFSNSAPFLNLLAPGRLITSSIPGGGVEDGFGTSVAAAHVSGAWAMLKQQQQAATVDEVLNKLTTFGVNITDPRNNVTKPRIKIDAALGINVPPNNWIGAYYDNPNLEGNPVLAQDDGSGFIDRNFTGISPVPGAGIGTEHYSIRWTRTVTFTAGTYRFSVTGDDGVKLYIDGQEKVNEWRNQAATTYNINVNLQAGNHEIRLEYYQHTGSAQARLIWGIFNPACLQTVAVDRWKGEYFNNANLAGSPVMVSDDDVGFLNFPWGDGGPSSVCSVFTDYFSARWTRTVNLGTAVYRFTVTGDNGVRLWVDNQLKIDRWTDTAGTNTADVQLSLGNHDIRLEYFENVGGASVSLSWAPLPPEAPSNLVASATSLSQINLNWADNSSFEHGFKIERWNGSGYSQINTVGANGATYADSGLAPSTTYTYRVRAFNSAGDSGYSNESSTTTFTCGFQVSPTSAEFGYGGGSSSVTVSSAAGCSWSATSNAWFVHITSGASGAGNGSVNYSVDYFNEYDGYRLGSLTVAGRTVTIEQWGPPCPFIEPEACVSSPAQSPPIALNQSTTNASPGGLTARYFSNMTLSGQPALKRIDPVVNFNWAGNGPDKALPADGFSVRWDGQLAAPSSEAYTFYLYSDDGARLWVNNRLVIDRWRPPFESQTRSAPVELKAGEKTDVRVEYYNAEGDAVTRLLWSSASTPKQIIPQRQLYPEAATNKSAPTDTNQQTGMLLPPGSAAGPKATRPQPGAASRWLASPLSHGRLVLLIACGVLALLLRINWRQARGRFTAVRTNFNNGIGLCCTNLSD